MDAATTVGAVFLQQVSVGVTIANTESTLFGGFGTNRVTGPATNCARTGQGTSSCAPVLLPQGVQAAFTVDPDPGDGFVRWGSGPCTGSTAQVCVFVPSGSSVLLTAVFSDT